jgi:hypothetical protein
VFDQIVKRNLDCSLKNFFDFYLVLQGVMERELGKTLFRMFDAREVCQLVLNNPPFSLGGRFDNKEISVEGKSAQHYGANQSQYVDPIVLPGTHWVRQKWVSNENGAILFIVAGKDDKMTHGFAADIIEDEIVAFRVFSGAIVEIGGAQAR